MLLWPVFGALVTHGLGKRLIPLSLAGQNANADFRSELVHARDKVAKLRTAISEEESGGNH